MESSKVCFFRSSRKDTNAPMPHDLSNFKTWQKLAFGRGGNPLDSHE